MVPFDDVTGRDYMVSQSGSVTMLCIYRPLAPRWSIGRPQSFSTGFCTGIVVQFGSIVGLYLPQFLFG